MRIAGWPVWRCRVCGRTNIRRPTPGASWGRNADENQIDAAGARRSRAGRRDRGARRVAHRPGARPAARKCAPGRRQPRPPLLALRLLRRPETGAGVARRGRAARVNRAAMRFLLPAMIVAALLAATGGFSLAGAQGARAVAGASRADRAAVDLKQGMTLEAVRELLGKAWR